MHTMTNGFSRSAIIFCLLAGFYLLAAPAFAQVPETNGYVADKPLALYSHEIIQGGLSYTIGSSYYSGKLYPGDAYTVSHSVSLPEGATLKFARLYSYWTWSAEVVTGMDPKMKLTFNGEELEPDMEYSDRKGWGIYDYPTGTWAYNVSAYVDGSGTFSTSVENTGPEASFICMDGIGLLVVYTDPNGKDIEYWIGEGADELNSQMDDNGEPLYYATPNQTICEMLRPTLSSSIGNATLWTVIQSGNWEDNLLMVNDNEISGICNGIPYPDLDTDTRDITGYLTAGENLICFQAVGDYVVPSNSFLVVETVPGASDTSEKEEVSGETEIKGDSTAEDSENKAPGFGFGFAVASLAAGKLAVCRKHQKD